MFDNLKKLRESKKLTQKEFANQLGVSYSTYNGYEVGIREPKSDFWIAVAEKYNVSLDYLLGLSDNPTSYIISNPTTLGILEYPIMTKYRGLNDSGKEYIDAQLDFALSQEKYQLASVIQAPIYPQEESKEDEWVDVSYAAFGGDSGTFKIPRAQFDDAVKALEAYDYTKDK